MAAQSRKDPKVALVISIAGMVILAAPAVGYIYLGNVKKFLVYLVVCWALVFGIVAVSAVAAALSGGIGGLCFLPLGILLLAFLLLIVYDVYVTAKGEKPKLPF